MTQPATNVTAAPDLSTLIGELLDTWGKRLLTIVGIGAFFLTFMTVLGWRRVDAADEIAATRRSVAALADTLHQLSDTVAAQGRDVQSLTKNVDASVYMNCELLRRVSPESVAPPECRTRAITTRGSRP